MALKFKTKVNGKTKYLHCTVPHEFCHKHKINCGDHFLINVKNKILHIMIAGSNSSKMVNIPLYLTQSLNLKPNQDITIKIIEKAEKRNRKIKMFEKSGRKYIDLYYSLPTVQMHANRDLVIFKRKNDKILVCGKGSCRRIEAPRYIELNERLFEVFGLYQGEGYKKQPRDAARVEFVNSNSNLIKHFMKYFYEVFMIPYEKWGAYIGYSGNVKTHDELVKYWSYTAKIPKENFQKTRFLDTKKKRWTENGNLHVLIVSSILIEIILGILECLQKIAIENKQWSIAFLRGVLAADAHVHLVKWPNITTLSMIEIAIENETEAKLYTKLLNRLNIESRDYSPRRKLVITHWDNLDKLAKLDAFKLHPDKNKAFIMGYNNHMKTTSFVQ